MSEPDFEILEHTADIGFRARGSSEAELFRNAVRALVAIATEPATIAPVTTREITIAGDDVTEQLVDLLSEVLYLFDAGRFATGDARVSRFDTRTIVATLVGEPRDPARHRWTLIVKAVTYHGLEVREHAGRWTARVFLDI